MYHEAFNLQSAANFLTFDFGILTLHKCLAKKTL